jgi:SWI/SNF-related matrix-associated actin-dependent regulator 1 of chromatin subfamily A
MEIQSRCIHVAPYRAVLVSDTSLSASLLGGEAMLRFPYDERLRQLLRAIPGRRWDPLERVWCVPLDPERAEALARLLAGLPGEPRVSDALARAIERRRARRRRDECLLDLARPDENWWLSFATDAAPEVVAALLEHPQAHNLPAIGRAVIPLDDHAVRLVIELGAGTRSLRLSDVARRALVAHGGGAGQEDRAPQVRTRPERAASWYGNVDVAGPSEGPVFLLLGDTALLPGALRGQAMSAPGGAAVPLTLDSWRLIDGQLGGWISGAARRCVAALKDGRPAPPAVLECSSIDDEETFVLAPGHNAALLEEFAALRGALPDGPRRAARHRHARTPAIRADPFCVQELDHFLTAHEIWVDPEALALLQEVREQHARAAGLVALSAATDASLHVPGLGGELKPFQRAGVRYLLSQRRAFLADEQGLGKTIEALATLEADAAYPAVIVCPASLKLNWLRESERWLPGRSAQVLVGAGAGGPVLASDITIVNYDVVGSRLDALSALEPRALVLDESHYCKNAAAKRTQAVQRLSAIVPRDGLILALTGTPVMNRPAELVAQLRILGRLGDFGSGMQFGSRFRGPDAHLRLHWHLRARCFARRLKADVLPQLPAKTRAVVPVELDNEPEYRLAERDVVAWLQSQPLDLRELDAKVAAALRAERLVRLNALKLLAARGKLHAVRSWIHDFCSSGERLVVFAHHREIQHAVLEHFPKALHILGEDSPTMRDTALRAFQAPDDAENQLIVCSVEVAGQGLTLTRSSNVAFLELDWTPAKHDQAEDRCHRIGQRDAVNASYLLAAGTIDETISTLLERKRAVIGAVTDGREEDEEGVVDALVRELRGAPYRHLRAVA